MAQARTPPPSNGRRGNATSWRQRFHHRVQRLPDIIGGAALVGFLLGLAVARYERRPVLIVKVPVVLAGGAAAVGLLDAFVAVPDGIAAVVGVAAAGGLYWLWNYFWPPVETGTSLFGSARWATTQDAMRRGRIHKAGYVLADSHGFALGRMAVAKGYDPRLRYMGHVLTCAPTGAGKGIGAVIPNLLEYPGSALVLDVKGENFATTARQRRNLGHEVYVVNPFGITGARTHAFNWLDSLNPKDPDVVSESAMLADMLVVHSGQGDPY